MIAYRSIVGVLPYPSINPGGQRVILIPAHPWASSTSCAHFFAALARDLRAILRELLLLHTETKVRKGMERILQIPLSPKSTTEVSDSVYLDAI